MKHKDLVNFIINSNLIEGISSSNQIKYSVDAWNYLRRKEALTNGVLLEVHRRLMQDLRPDIAGRFRDVNVRVGNRVCPEFWLVEALVEDWLVWCGTCERIKMNYGSLCGDYEIQRAHVEFEKIHPFEDGNGRVGRLLWLWHREKAKLPFKLIEFGDRHEYYKWFV